MPPSPPPEKVHWKSWAESLLLQHDVDIMRLWRRAEPGQPGDLAMAEIQPPIPIPEPEEDPYLLVRGNSGNKFKVLQEDGSVLSTFSNLGTLQVLDSDGNYYTRGFDGGFSKVRKFDAENNEIWSVSDPDMNLITWLDVDASGNVYYCGFESIGGVLNSFTTYLVKLNSSGAEQWRAEGGVSNPDGEPKNWQCCAVDASGNVAACGARYVLDGAGPEYKEVGWHIRYFNSSGAEQWTEAATGSTDDRTALRCAFDSAGALYVAYQTTGTVSDATDLEKLSAAGSSVWVKNLATEVVPHSLEISPSGKLLIAFHQGSPAANHRIEQYSGASHGTLDWTFNFPTTNGIYAAYDEDGDVYGVQTTTSPADNLWKLAGATGSEIYSVRISTSPSQVLPSPGRHPNFI